MTHLGWPQVVVIVAMTGFASFALWLTASHFDASELKTLGLMAASFTAREVIPFLKSILAPTTDSLSRGRVE